VVVPLDNTGSSHCRQSVPDILAELVTVEDWNLGTNVLCDLVMPGPARCAVDFFVGSQYGTRQPVLQSTPIVEGSVVGFTKLDRSELSTYFGKTSLCLSQFVTGGS
jgi:hypothetical protein